MSILEARNSICLSCKQFSFCIMHWGADCKRQGGKKIPRMKSVPHELRWQVDTPAQSNKCDRPEKPEKSAKASSQIKQRFEKIKTKLMTW